jgi:hypothetical protein
MVKVRFHRDGVDRKKELLQPLGDGNGISGRLFRKRWMISGMTLIMFLFSAISAEAGMVYGRVSGVEGGVFTPEDTFEIYDSQNRRLKEVRTDSEGGYSVLLPEGVFRVIYHNTWEAWIQSTPSAVRQDIYLRPRGR